MIDATRPTGSLSLYLRLTSGLGNLAKVAGTNVLMLDHRILNRAVLLVRSVPSER